MQRRNRETATEPVVEDLDTEGKPLAPFPLKLGCPFAEPYGPAFDRGDFTPKRADLSLLHDLCRKVRMANMFLFCSIDSRGLKESQEEV